MKKLLLLFASIFAVVITANTQVLFQENFNYATGTALTANGWTITGTSVVNVINTASPGLMYSGYMGSNIGISASLTTTGQDVYNSFAVQTSGTVYASVLVNVSAAQIGDYFFHFTQGLITSNAFYGRVFARMADNGKLTFGLSKSSISVSIPAVYSDSIYSLNTTYLLVVKYLFNTGGTTDDEVSLFVLTDPNLPLVEPETPTVGPISTSQTDALDLDIVNFRQGSATLAPTLLADGIRVGKSWSEAATFNPFDDPSSLTVKNSEAGITVDGKLDEGDWNGAPSVLFGNGAHLKKQGGDKTGTGGFDIKATFGVNGTDYHLPNMDSSWLRVKFLRKGTDLFIGLQSNDKSICKFDWEGDGLFLKIKNSVGEDKEYKLYWQNIDANKDTIRYEEGVLNSGNGAGFLMSGSTVNDTLDVDNGYTAELRLKLSSLGYTGAVNSVQLSMAMFDPDGYQHPMNSWDSARGSYYKSWWGSEWGGTYRTLEFIPEITKYDDPAKLVVKNADAAVNVDGKLDEADWNGAPSLFFGNGAHLKKQGGDQTATGGFDIKATFGVNGTDYHLPNIDSSWTRVKFLRKGTDLFIGLQSNDKSICKFDWEGDGLFLKIKNSAGEDKEYKLYWQNIDANKDTIRYEEGVLNSGNGAGFLMSGSTVNDTMNVDNGYSAEFRLKLGSLGYTGAVNSVQLSMAIFDPDGYQHPMNSWDSARGSYHKSWWGSEWGGTYRMLEFTPEVIKYDDPAKLVVKNADGVVTVDGKLDEGDWNGAPSVLFGNGAHMKKQGGDKTGTGGFDIKATFGVNGTDYHLPNKDSSWLRVKFLRKGTDLFIGLQSNDKSICKFDWEGDGLFLKIKNSVGEDKEYKLYWQNIDANKDTIRYEEGVLNSGNGAGFLMSGSTVNDTLDVDNGYTAELRLKLSSLGYTGAVNSVQLSMAMFDPDGYKHPMNSWDSARGSYYKSWWGSEWGGTYRTLEFISPYDSPDTIVANIASSVMTLDGKLDEADWSSANTLIFGPSNAPKTGNEKTVTGSVDVKKNFDVGGVMYSLPYKDTSFTKVKFLAKGNDLYIGIQSPDKSICKFDWEGDGLFLKIKNSIGEDKEYKLYWQNIDANKDTIRYEEQVLNSGAGSGFLISGSSVNDTTNVDNGYTAELRVRLNTLGFAPNTNKVDLTVSMAIFDPDGYQHPMAPWDSARGSYFKSWWGSEWGGVYKTIAFPKTTGVQEEGEIPLVFSLNQNYPNPFNPSTVIQYSVPVATPVVLKVYNMIGQEVMTLVNREHKAGNYEVKFDAGRLASGIYIYRIQAGTFVGTKKMMLIK